MLLSVVLTYKGGTIGHMLCKYYNGRAWDHRTYVTFWDTLWVMPRRTRHLLDHCAKTTRRTIGLLDVCCSVRELVVNFPINSSFHLSFLTHVSFPWYAPRLPKPFP
jgi:hypothetical protein